ncbi:MAG: RNA polymerase sigma factor SigZ [Acidobacteriota bacterium]
MDATTPPNAIDTEKLWSALRQRLQGFFVSRTRDAALSADLVQETFVRVHEKLGDLRETERLESWVFSIARHLLTDHHRRRPTQELPHDLPERTAPEEQDTDDNCNGVVASWLPAAIEHLPDTYREAVRLEEIEGLPQAEIAERLGISLSGAKSRIQRGRAKLVAALHDCCSFELDRRGNVLGWVQDGSRSCCGDTKVSPRGGSCADS